MGCLPIGETRSRIVRYQALFNVHLLQGKCFPSYRAATRSAAGTAALPACRRVPPARAHRVDAIPSSLLSAPMRASRVSSLRVERRHAQREIFRRAERAVFPARANIAPRQMPCAGPSHSQAPSATDSDPSASCSIVQGHSEHCTSIGFTRKPCRCASFTRTAGE